MKTMTDNTGAEIPLKYVSQYDRAREKLTKDIQKAFEKERQNLEKLVINSLDKIAKFREDFNRDGTQKGNFQVTSFDGLTTVEISQQYNIKLDDRVAVARQKMLNYAVKASGKIGGQEASAVEQIVRAAFEPNRAGLLPYTKILALLRLKINVPEWIDARQILIDSIGVTKGKAYLHCLVRETMQQDPKQIRLDIADCWPDPAKEEEGGAK